MTCLRWILGSDGTLYRIVLNIMICVGSRLNWLITYQDLVPVNGEAFSLPTIGACCEVTLLV